MPTGAASLYILLIVNTLMTEVVCINIHTSLQDQSTSIMSKNLT